MRLIYPLNELLEDVADGELVLVEYDSVSQEPLLPLKLATENEGILVEIGDRLSVKIPALLDLNDIRDKMGKLKILNVSNYPIELEGFDIKNVKLDDLLSVMSNVYEFLKNFGRDRVVVIEGFEMLALYYNVKSVLKDFAGLKVMLPHSTMFYFVNYEVIERRYLAIIESLATTVIRFTGVLKENGIVKRMYLLKSVRRPKRTYHEVRDREA